MPLFSGLLALLAVWALCAFFAEKFDLNPALLPLPVLAGAVALLCLFGFVGLLPVGGWLFYLGALAAAVWLFAAKRAGSAFRRLLCPGFVFFVAAGLVFLVLFALTKPMFIYWDEFTFWGSAAKATKLQNALHALPQSNVQARSYLPGMPVLTYLFQFFGSGFSEWSAFFAYDTLFAAAMSAAVALPKKRWASAAVLLLACFMLPYFFSAPALGGVSNLYVNVMGDLPLAFVFGGALCLYFNSTKEKPAFFSLLATLGFLALIKDIGLAYAAVAAGVICADWLFQAGRPTLKRLGRTLCCGGALAVPVVGFYLGWSKYYAFASGASKTALSGEGKEMSQFAVLGKGLAQLLGREERSEVFQQVYEKMLASPFAVPICLLGGGVLAAAAIFVVLAVAALALPKGERWRPALFGGLMALGLVAFLVFHLFLYVFVFSNKEALELKDYIRYIGPYYMGWMLAAIGLLSRAAGQGRWPGLTRLAGLGLAGAFCLLIGLRGMPVAGFWNYPHTLYDTREDVAGRAAQVNSLLSWDDTVLLISQGDPAIRWNYYGYELNAHLGRGFGGFGYGPGLTETVDWWNTTHMNIVNPVDAGEGRAEVYEYQTVATPDDIARFLLEKRYTHVLVDTSDPYFAVSIAGRFGVRDLPTARTGQVYLLKINYEGDTVTWAPVEGGGLA